MIIVAGVSKRFGPLTALNDVSLSVMPGAVQCIIGPSGSGKSTLLRCIHQCEAIDSGAITIAGEPIGDRRVGDERRELSDAERAHQRRKTGMVLRQADLLGHLTVLQNIIEGPLTVLKRPRREIVATGMALLERVGLAETRDSYPVELAGSQQQRVAIARVLAMEPQVMLFDEPTAALGPEHAGEVLDAMRDLAASGMTMIVVTDELGFIREVASDVAVMDKGEIVEQGPPQQVAGRVCAWSTGGGADDRA